MSIHDVSRKAGVSPATVSRVFNFPDKVSGRTRERVEAVAREMGYQPHSVARTLRTQRSQVLGVVLPTLLNPVFAECLQGIAHAATAGGYSIIPVTTDYRLDLETRAVSLLLARGVDGLILVVADPQASLALQRLAEAGVPYVLAYNRHARHPCVSVDGQAAVADVVRRLIELGHRRITMVSGPLAASDRALQRHRGYVRAMARAGLEPTLLEVPFLGSATDSLCHTLTGRARPTALLCANDLLAIRSIRAARLCGLDVPGDLSVTGFDGMALGEELTPALSTVMQPNAEIGRGSVELLAQALAAGSTPGAAASIVLPTTFRTGESCAAAPRPVRGVARRTRATVPRPPPRSRS